jgi:D-beta-D-heptose 7-phosphate kinase/D-beta-D-heptose 1-phosphate adenosyltransferase
MSHSELLDTFNSLGHPRVLVLGDLILDRYTWGNAERVSQEAPVILLRADEREARLGGAANVCNMLRGLEAAVSCAGVVGNDSDGQTLRRMLDETGIEECLLTDDSRPTTVKERFLGRAANRHAHQILRVDSESREPLCEALETELCRRLVDRLDNFQMFLISDYDKGVCTPRLLETLVGQARRRNIPVLVDPIRGTDYSRYRGATSMTPNRLEAELSSGVKIRTIDDAFAAGRRLCEMLDLDSAIVTLDRDGMALVERGGGACRHFPTRPRDVYDITGAGDMVLAMLGLALADGLALPDAIRLANIAGGLEVEKVGVVRVSRDEIRADLQRNIKEGGSKILAADEAEQIVAALRARGHQIAFTNGCFDLLHVGHITYLAEAAEQGDVLIVAVNSDASVRKLKGPGRPVIGERDRAAMLAALACVDYVIVFDEPTPEPLLRRLRPDVLVKGGDYRGRPNAVVGWEIVVGYGGRIHVAGVVEGVSTTNILRSMAA